MRNIAEAEGLLEWFLEQMRSFPDETAVKAGLGDPARGWPYAHAFVFLVHSLTDQHFTNLKKAAKHGAGKLVETYCRRYSTSPGTNEGTGSSGCPVFMGATHVERYGRKVLEELAMLAEDEAMLKRQRQRKMEKIKFWSCRCCGRRQALELTVCGVCGAAKERLDFSRLADIADRARSVFGYHLQDHYRG